MRAARDIAEGSGDTAPLELQVGWLINRHGLAVLGEQWSFTLLMRATKLADVHRIWSKMIAVGPTKMSTGEMIFIRDTMEQMQ